MSLLGLLFSFGALLSWTFGDFFIQRTTRHVGSVQALFFIGIFGMIGLLPFVYTEIPELFQNSFTFTLIGVTIAVTLFSALFDFEALRVGKLSVIQPIFGTELPLTVGLSVLLHNEILTKAQFAIMLLVFLGILFTIFEGNLRDWKQHAVLEKGVIYAGVGVVSMSVMNLLTGMSSQETGSPLLAIWSIHSGLAILCFLYLVITKKIQSLFSNLRKYPQVICAQAIFDNAAWILFCYAVLLLPISIVMIITEGYVALSVLLGVFVNREKIKPHQIIGIAFAVTGILLLSWMVG